VSAAALVVSVVVTLLVYWIAEDAEVVASRLKGAGFPAGHPSEEP
jgi:hypothetical protein